jgi:hypothetical protein
MHTFGLIRFVGAQHRCALFDPPRICRVRIS